ncbi:MAG: hypothetical protein KGI27_14295 [Thaumarchaeota archaeon]|nr:hypothetical protein [Nitrososphaerota archaeon]
MPIFTPTIQQQNNSTTAGIRTYPNFGPIQQNLILQDDFSRQTLSPTNAIPAYTVGVVGSGTGTATGGNHGTCLLLTTSTATNDCVSAQVSANRFKRTSQYIDLRSNIALDVIFDCGENNVVTNYSFFIGLVATANALTAVPTTARHMGIYGTSGGNFFLSSSDGTTQTTTDTGVAVDQNVLRRLNISWTGTNSAVISLYSGSTYSTLVKSQTATSLSSDNLYELFFFVLTNTTAAKDLEVYEWRVVTL